MIERESRETRLGGRIAGLVIALLTVAYPFIVYFSLGRFPVAAIAAILLGLAAIRWWFSRASTPSATTWMPLLLAIAVIGLLALWRDDGRVLLYYPVSVNLALLIAFLVTVFYPPSMVERFARLQEPDLPAAGIVYCRKVTLVWCAFFTVNGGVALATAVLGDMRVWTLYNGLISYVALGLLFAIEFAVRQKVRRRYEREQAEGKG